VTDDLDALRTAAAAPPGAARALPFAAYRDPGVFDLEMERAFRGDWVAVCAEAALADLGLRVLRVRDHGARARLEVGTDELPLARARARDVERLLGDAGFERYELAAYLAPAAR